MSERNPPAKQVRQVTVQPQEPAPPKGDPAREPESKPARKAAPGQQDRRSGGNRDGLE